MTEDFDLLVHIEKEEPKEDDEVVDEDEYGEQEDDGIPVDKFAFTTPNIQNFWIKLLPGQDEFC